MTIINEMIDKLNETAGESSFNNQTRWITRVRAMIEILHTASKSSSRPTETLFQKHYSRESLIDSIDDISNLNVPSEGEFIITVEMKK